MKIKKKIKVAHICFSDNRGGASIAANRLNISLNKNGVISKIFVIDKNNRKSEKLNNTIFEKLFYFFYRLVEISLRKIVYRKSKTIHSFNFFNTNVKKKISIFNPDILHLHYIASNTISLKEINKIDLPVVWTLHDLWPILPTSHLEYNEILNRKKNFFEYYIDNKIYTLKKKLKVAAFIAPSMWVKKKVNLNKDFRRINTFKIANTLDTNFFKKNEIEYKNNNLNLGYCVDGLKQHHKGFDLFSKIIKNFSRDSKKKTIIHFLGDKNFEEKLNLNFKQKKNLKIIQYPKTKNKIDLIKFYSKLDLLLVTSRTETFCQVASEAMSCSVPIVAFKIGGLIDIVDSKKLGRLIKPFDIKSFSNAIIKLSNNKRSMNKMSSNCRNHAIKNFDYKIISNKTHKIYKYLLDR